MSREPERPHRPLIPVTLPALVSLYVAMRATEARMTTEWAVSPVAAAGIVTMLAAGLGLLWSRRVPALSRIALGVSASLAAASVGFLLGSDVIARSFDSADDLSKHPVSSYSVLIDADAMTTSSGYWTRATVTRDGGMRGQAWISSTVELARGERIRCIGRFSANEDDDWGSSSAAQGVSGTIKVVRILSRQQDLGLLRPVMAARDEVIGFFDPTSSRERALLAGVICARRTEMKSSGDEALFATCGLAHLIAVSGSHLAIVATMLGWILEQASLRPWVRISILGVILGLFVAFCGMPASAVRSWLMCLVGFGSRLAGRRGHALSSVCLVALAMIVARPATAGELGFLLSASSVIGLCLYTSYLSYAMKVLMPRAASSLVRSRPVRKIARTAEESLSSSANATLVAQAATLPSTIDAFRTVSLAAPLANVVVGPFFFLLVCVGFVAAALSPVPIAGGMLLACADCVSWITLRLVEGLASIPFASVAVMPIGLLGHAIALGAGIGLLAWWPRLSRRVIAMAIATPLVAVSILLVRWRFLAPARIVVLDVGQGDAILVQDGATSVLLDTGPSGEVDAALARMHVLHLDAVILTHLHDDHVGGVGDLAGMIDAGRVMVAEGVSENESDRLRQEILDDTGAPSDEISYGDELSVGRFRLRCVWPRERVDGNENGDSLCFSVEFDDGERSLSGFLTGDAEKDEAGAIIDAGDVSDVDFLKVGHHGSEASLDDVEAHYLDAEVAIASAGRDNPYGHPTEVCVDTLERSGARFLCTMDAGDVSVEPARGGILVETRPKDSLAAHLV